MLLNIHGDAAQVIPGDAHIVIAIDVQRGGLLMQAFCRNRHDATYAAMPQQRLIERELPKLLDELRAQLQPGMSSSGSTVTE